MSARLQVLVLTPSVPASWWGFGTRVLQLSRHLATRYDVSILTYAWPSDAEDIDALRRQGMEVIPVLREDLTPMARRLGQVTSLLRRPPFGVLSLHDEAMQAALDRVLAERLIDVVLIESSHICSFRLPERVTTVLDQHNIEYELLQRMQEGERSLPRRAFNRVEGYKCRRHERRAWTEVDAIAVTSDREAPIVRDRAGSAPVAVVPNAVDLDYFRPSGHSPTPGSMVFTGLLSYRPNLDAAHHFLDEVLPRVQARYPGATMTIVGQGDERDLERMRRPGVVVTGRVPDIRPIVADAAVVVVPLRIGSGTRLKVVEAMAMGKAIVSTSLGHEGIDVEAGTHLLTADEPEAFAEATVSLLADPARASELGRAARSLAVQQYSWTSAGERLEDLIERARSRSGVPTS